MTLLGNSNQQHERTQPGRRGGRVRVVHILAELGFSGGEVQLAHLLKHLATQGHQNRLLLQPGAEFANAARECGVPVEEIKMRAGVDVHAVRAVRRVISRERPDLVHFACSRAHKLGALATMGVPGLARVVTRRMDYPPRLGPVSRWLYGSAVDRAVVVSDAVRAELMRVGVPATRIVRIYDGVDPNALRGEQAERAGALARLGWPTDAKVVACAASLRPRKGQLHLVRAFKAVIDHEPKARLLLAGEGSDREALQAEVRRCDLDERVQVPGRMARCDVLGAADVACIPSIREGLSVFSLEAMAVGVPVVASAVGGLPESIADGATGLLVPPAEPAELATAIRRLLADPDLRRRMGRAGEARVRQGFTAARMATRTEQLYGELVVMRQGRSARVGG
ncbi:MAG: glycosyltransferase [Planctomycetota bacterium]